MAEIYTTAVDLNPVLARGRGLAKLIEGLSNGDPVAWIILVVVVLIFGGIAVYKRMYGSDE